MAAGSLSVCAGEVSDCAEGRVSRRGVECVCEIRSFLDDCWSLRLSEASGVRVVAGVVVVVVVVAVVVVVVVVVGMVMAVADVERLAGKHAK